MFSIINNSKSGMSASQGKLDIVSQNLVNSQTNGYKKLDMNFSDLLPDSLNRGYIPRNKELQMDGGVRTTNPIRVFTQGVLKSTGNSTDIAIDGKGMFAVTTPNGDVKYTRSSDFALDSEGKLVDLNGNTLNIDFVDGINYGNANLTTTNLTINGVGEVFSDGNLIGKIGVYTTVGENNFLSTGDSLYTLKDGLTVTPSTDFTVMQGYVELSNVDIIDEMTDMMAMQKALQFNAKGLQMANDMWGMVNNLQSK